MNTLWLMILTLAPPLPPTPRWMIITVVFIFLEWIQEMFLLVAVLRHQCLSIWHWIIILDGIPSAINLVIMYGIVLVWARWENSLDAAQHWFPHYLCVLVQWFFLTIMYLLIIILYASAWTSWAFYSFKWMYVHYVSLSLPTVWHKYFIPRVKHRILSWVIWGNKCSSQIIWVISWWAKWSSRSMQTWIISPTRSPSLKLHYPVFGIWIAAEVKHSFWTIWKA